MHDAEGGVHCHSPRALIQRLCTERVVNCCSNTRVLPAWSSVDGSWTYCLWHNVLNISLVFLVFLVLKELLKTKKKIIKKKMFNTLCHRISYLYGSPQDFKCLFLGQGIYMKVGKPSWHKPRTCTIAYHCCVPTRILKVWATWSPKIYNL